MRKNPSSSNQLESSPSSQRLAEEKWIDGPRVSKYRVAEARHLMREINHIKQCETWIDGPNIKPKTQPQTAHSGTQSYGFMDSHKKKMIRQWVENQTCQIFQQVETVSNANAVQYHTYYKSQSAQNLPHKSEVVISQRNDDDQHSCVSSKHDEFINPLIMGGLSNLSNANANYSECAVKTSLKQQQNHQSMTMTMTNDYDQDIHSEKSISNASESRQFMMIAGMEAAACVEMEEEDQDSGPSEVPPALPLIDPLCCSREVSRHVSRESLNVIMMDCALQVTEEDIAKAMGG